MSELSGADRVSADEIPAAQRLKVAYVLGTTTGGTGRHVAMLADGCARRGVAVTVLGPALPERLLFLSRRIRGSSTRMFRDHGSSCGWRSPTGPARPATLPRCCGCGGCSKSRRQMSCMRTGCAPGRSRHSRWQAGRPAAARCSSRCTTPRPRRARPVLSTRSSSGSSPAGRTRWRACRQIWRLGCGGWGRRDGGRALVPAPPAASPTADEVERGAAGTRRRRPPGRPRRGQARRPEGLRHAAGGGGPLAAA